MNLENLKFPICTEDYITIKHLLLYKFSITENVEEKGLLIKQKQHPGYLIFSPQSFKYDIRKTYTTPSIDTNLPASELKDNRAYLHLLVSVFNSSFTVSSASFFLQW